MKCFVSANASAVMRQQSYNEHTMSDEAPKVSAHDTVPCSALPTVKLDGVRERWHCWTSAFSPPS
jgi:hypothetical protein